MFSACIIFLSIMFSFNIILYFQVHIILGVYCYVAYQEVKLEEQVAFVAQLKKAD